MGNDIDLDQLEQGLAIGAVGFGVVATVAPRVFTALYGLGNDPKLITMTRLWGSSTATLGTLSLIGAIDSTKGNPIITGLNVANTVLIARADGIPARSKVLGALTSAGFAAGFGYLAARRR
ncbi:MAG: hypothetical protein QOD98_3612 [Nocardioidaceae bacterium]|nr:hypothetical protein [Nocardioidaceae bacterium]